jgi:hypothetical protein
MPIVRSSVGNIRNSISSQGYLLITSTESQTPIILSADVGKTWSSFIETGESLNMNENSIATPTGFFLIGYTDTDLIKRIKLNNNKIIARGTNAVYASSINRGTTWTSETSDSEFPYFVDGITSDGFMTWIKYTGYYGWTIVSKDNGVTWKPKFDLKPSNMSYGSRLVFHKSVSIWYYLIGSPNGEIYKCESDPSIESNWSNIPIGVSKTITTICAPDDSEYFVIGDNLGNITLFSPEISTFTDVNIFNSSSDPIASILYLGERKWIISADDGKYAIEYDNFSGSSFEIKTISNMSGHTYIKKFGNILVAYSEKTSSSYESKKISFDYGETFISVDGTSDLVYGSNFVHPFYWDGEIVFPDISSDYKAETLVPYISEDDKIFSTEFFPEEQIFSDYENIEGIKYLGDRVWVVYSDKTIKISHDSGENWIYEYSGFFGDNQIVTVDTYYDGIVSAILASDGFGTLKASYDLGLNWELYSYNFYSMVLNSANIASPLVSSKIIGDKIYLMGYSYIFEFNILTKANRNIHLDGYRPIDILKYDENIFEVFCFYSSTVLFTTDNFASYSYSSGGTYSMIL